MRSILDAHSKVRCVKETPIIPRLLGYREALYPEGDDETVFAEDGLSVDDVKSAFASFMLEVSVFYK